MSERVLPGVSITEITEGLVGIPSPGEVAVKLVGTSSKGPITAQYFGAEEIERFRQMYGPQDPYVYSVSTSTQYGSNHSTPPMELTLRRAGEMLFSNAPPGGIHVCRAQSGAVNAAGKAITATGTFQMVFTANEPGQWFNMFQWRHDADKDALGNAVTGVNTLYLNVPSLDLIDTSIDTTNQATSRISDNPFFFREIPFEYFGTSETTAFVADLISMWTNSANQLNQWFDISCETSVTTDISIAQQTTSVNLLTADDVGGTNWSTDDIAEPTTTIYNVGLDLLRGKDAFLTTIAGVSDSTTRFNGVISSGVSHAQNASADKLEQFFICGTEVEATEQTFVDNVTTSTGFALANYRAIKVAPGALVANPFYTLGNNVSANTYATDTISGGYVANAAAGLIAKQIPYSSSMNKPFGFGGFGGLEHEFSLTNKKRLVRSSFFLLVNDVGFRSLRDLTSAPDSDPFYHISTRGAIDHIRRAIRLAGQPFLGYKNNARIRAILKNSLEVVLRRYVKREVILSNWELSISSTRSQQIAGAVEVIMRIQPIFYIEFIEVSLILE